MVASRRNIKAQGAHGTSFAGAMATWNKGPEFGPGWYPLTLVALSLPLAWIGGKLRLEQLNSNRTT